MAANQKSHVASAAPSEYLFDSAGKHGYSNAIILQNQPLPVPGTALTGFLRRYRMELLSAERTREISTLVECCDLLLLTAANREVRR